MARVEMNHLQALQIIGADVLIGLCYILSCFGWMLAGYSIFKEEKDITSNGFFVMVDLALIFTILSHLISAGVIK